MKFLDLTVLTALAGLLGLAVRVAGKWIAAGYKFTKSWQDGFQSLADLVQEVKNIRAMMESGKEWMIRGDEQFKRHGEEIESLKDEVSDHKDRIAWLEGKANAMKSIIILMVLFSASFAKAQVYNVDGHLYWWTAYYATIDSLLQIEYPEVPKGIDQACAEGESHFDTTAIRFEPKYKVRYLKTIKAHSKAWLKKHHNVRSLETEIDQRCYSYNMHQNMGENLREDGYDEPTISTFTARVDIVMFYRVFNRRLQKYKKKHGVHHVTREVFLDACADYNGGPGAIRSRGHYRNWDYVKDKEERMTRIAGIHEW